MLFVVSSILIASLNCNLPTHNQTTVFLPQKKMCDLEVQLTCSVEKEQNYLKQFTTLNADLEREAYDHF